jgi:hypothetical protein
MQIRLSGETDESTSPGRHQAQTRGYCDLRDCNIANVAMDLDVSGRI